MSKEAPPLSVIGPDGKARDLTLEAAGPGKWHLSLDAPEPGLYRFKSADLEALAHAGADNSREFQNVTATADPLAPLLKESGGGPFWPVLANSSLAAVPTVSLPRISLFSGTKLLHGSDWAGLADRDAHLITGVKLTPLVSGFAALALLLGLASLAWWREGR